MLAHELVKIFEVCYELPRTYFMLIVAWLELYAGEPLIDLSRRVARLNLANEKSIA